MNISKSAIAQVVLMDRELDRAEPELRAFIDRLSEDEQAELVGIMWVGRGSFETEEIAQSIGTPQAEATTPCADYLIGTPHLSDHLQYGLEVLGYSLTDDEDDLMRGG